MRALGCFGVVSGIAMVVAGLILLFILRRAVLDPAVLSMIGVPALVGVIAILCGALCWAHRDTVERFDALSERMARLERQLIKPEPQQMPETPEQTVDELRMEGLLGAEKPLDDEAIERILE